MTVAVDAFTVSAAGDVTAAVFVVFPATAVAGVTNATTDTRTRRTTTTTAIEQHDFEMCTITS